MTKKTPTSADEKRESKRVDVAIEEAALRVSEMRMDAWAVISNASDWDDPSRAEWRVAAKRWRDRWM